MPAISAMTGILLTIVGITAFSLTGSTHKTALIPCAFGVLIFFCGAAGSNPKWLKHAMHVAAMVGVLGALAGIARCVMGLVKLAKGDEVKVPALLATGAMALVCGIFVFLCVRSFIEARQARVAAAQAGHEA